MPRSFDLDVASGLSQGARSYQEEAVIAEVSRGSEVGAAVLSDDTGGQAASDVASKTAVARVPAN